MSEKIILDTDIDTDCDDAGALAVLHYFSRHNKAEILGVVCDIGNPWTAACVRAINSAYGKTDIPVGLCARPYTGNLQYEAHYRRCQRDGVIYNEHIARSVNVIPGENFFPEEGVALYRRLLASAPDHSVTICAIGLLTVLADLLISGPCAESPLSGYDLVSRKVKQLLTMAKAFFPEGHDGFNWDKDRSAAAQVINNWPTPVIVNPLGEDILTGQDMFAVSQNNNPVAMAYRVFGLGNPNFRRPSWDQVTVIASVGAGTDLFEQVDGGQLTYDAESGCHRWHGTKAGQRFYLNSIASPRQQSDYIDAMMAEQV